MHTPFINVVQRFQEMAKLFPDRTALIADHDSLTYGELKDLTDRMSGGLRETGFQKGDFISVLSEKSFDAIASMLAILQSGCVYHPLTAAQSQERNIRILNMVMPKGLLLGKGLKAKSLSGVSDQTRCVGLQELGQCTPVIPDVRISDQDQAYIISTSGSTGEPSSVGIRHNSLTNYLRWKSSFYEFTRLDMKLQFAPLSFDSSLSDLFSMLTNGGGVFLPQDQDRTRPDRIRHLLEHHPITSFAIVPSLYGRLLPELGGLSHSLRIITVAGEKVSAALVSQHQDSLPGVRLINEYGPCECTIGVTAEDLTQHPRGQEPLLGRAIAGTEIVILDDLSPQPPLAVGEICIRGIQTGMGYYREPEKTRESFVRLPGSGDLLYRSKDMGYLNHECKLIFSGRKDRMVKVHGNRVHLSEVEKNLASVKGVEEVAAVWHKDRIMALCVSKREPSEIRKEMFRLVPPYMVPSLILSCQEIPVNINGKKDYTEVVRHLSQKSGEDNKVFSPVSRKISAIWSKSLATDSFGLHDDFFDSGGDSVLFIEVLSQISREFPEELNLGDLSEKTTVASLAEYIESKSLRKGTGHESSS